MRRQLYNKTSLGIGKVFETCKSFVFNTATLQNLPVMQFSERSHSQKLLQI